MGCGELLGSGHIFSFEILNTLQTNKLYYKAHLKVKVNSAWHGKNTAQYIFKRRFSSGLQVLFLLPIYQLGRSRSTANGSSGSHFAECNFIQQ